MPVRTIPDAEFVLEDDRIEGVQEICSDRQILEAPVPMEDRVMGRALGPTWQIDHLHRGTRMRELTRE
jgi:hypothetical protein